MLCDISDNINENIYKDLFVKIVKVDYSHSDSKVNCMILKDEKVFKYEKLIFLELTKKYMSDLDKKMENYNNLKAELYKMLNNSMNLT